MRERRRPRSGRSFGGIRFLYASRKRPEPSSRARNNLINLSTPLSLLKAPLQECHRYRPLKIISQFSSRCRLSVLTVVFFWEQRRPDGGGSGQRRATYLLPAPPAHDLRCLLRREPNAVAALS
ncbi:hypothetical protein EVAR_70973_1 [Eumeta japonica]|uniref:Uncharacterized protein n=1 Tax=Eumeta variegata TaxID=151549 RepID=A0A4C2A6F2_EUMVA|nr:hypothetical protein EVAR_70973_1 [Eumeta japonica]